MAAFNRLLDLDNASHDIYNFGNRAMLISLLRTPIACSAFCCSLLLSPLLSSARAETAAIITAAKRADARAVERLIRESGNGEAAMHGAACKEFPRMVQFLVRKGANEESWNRKNKYGWTPLRIAQRYRSGNFRPSAEMIEAIQRVLPPKVSASTSGSAH